MAGVRVVNMSLQKQREEERAARFRALHAIAERGHQCGWTSRKDTVEYRLAYADYLEWDGVLSPQRADLIAALRADE